MKPTLYLAPIRGITNQIYRNIFPKHFKGFEIAFAPFIAAKGKDKLRDAYIRDFEPGKNRGLKTIPQILTGEPEEFISIAGCLSEMGYDMINWNLGCPYPMVINRGKGAAMIPHPEKIDSFLEKIIPRVNAKISVKLRLGMSCADEILHVLPVLNRYPLHEIIIHARTARQMYEGSVDLDSFEKCLPLLKHEIVYNGDINSLAVYKTLSERFSLTGKWMIGRGVLTNPFLGEEIKQYPSFPEDVKINKIHAFHDNLFEEYAKVLSGPSHLLDKMKDFWMYLAESFEDSRKITKQIGKIHNVKHYLETTGRLFSGGLRFKQDK